MDKDTIRLIFNSLFIAKNGDEVVPRIATAGISAKRKLTSTYTGENFTEEINVPKMPINPSAPLPMPEGSYKEIQIEVYFNKVYFICLEDVKLEGEITLRSLFKAATDFGKIRQMGKTYMDDKKQPEQAPEDLGETKDFDVSGKKISITKKGDAYKITDSEGNDISPDSKEGKQAISKYIRSMF